MADTLLGRLGRKAAELLGESAPSSAEPAAAPKTLRAEETVPDAPPMDLESQVRAVLQQQRTHAGEPVVHFISLAKVRERIGDGWERTAQKVDEIACQEIERRLAPIDVFRRIDELNYLVLFARMTRAQAQLKCALIAEDIAKRLLGADFDSAALEVKTALVQADSSIILENVPRIAELAEHLFNAQVEQPFADGTNGRVQVEPGLAALERVRLVYRPMWDVRQNALATYICVPAVEAPGDTLVTGEAAVPGLTDPDTALVLDTTVLARLAEDLRSLENAKRKLLLVAPVHFETVASRRRREAYVRLCGSIPPQSRKLTIFELVDVPAAIPANRLLELAIQFRRFSRAVILRLPVSHFQFPLPTETGIFAVGADLSDSDRSETELMRHMERFVAGASKTGLRTYVHGLGSVSLTTAAVGSGFDYIDGDIITSVVEAPRAAYRFEARNIYSNPFRRAPHQQGGSP